MKETKKYRSFSFSPLLSIKILIYGSLILFVVTWIMTRDITTSVLLPLVVIGLIQTIYIASSLTTISLTDNWVSLQNWDNHILIKNLENYTTWWSYNFSESSLELGDAGTGKVNPVANKINIFVKFESSNEVGYIYEVIELGEKFPNNHPYLANNPIDKSKLVKVWDVDNCLKALELT